MDTPRTERRLDLDWLRIIAFGLLILYHIGMYYVTWDWHVKSPFASATIEPLMRLTNPWRLALLFLVSGAATRFMAARMRSPALARSRSTRLLIPLAFAVFVVVPPQSYYEVVEKIRYADGFAEFYKRYLLADRGFCRNADCLIVPTWNHMWFVAYLWIYTMLVAALLARWPDALHRFGTRLQELLTGAGLLFWPWLALAAARWFLFSWSPPSNNLVFDWYNHALYLTTFALGYLLAEADDFWHAVVRQRWLALLLALASYAFMLVYVSTYSDDKPPPDPIRMFQRGVYAMDQWSSIVAALGFARSWLNVDGPARRYLTDAVFAFYIVHQTAIIVVAHNLKPLALAPAIEGPILVATTALACVATYELAKRILWLRPLLGLKRAAKLQAPSSR